MRVHILVALTGLAIGAGCDKKPDSPKQVPFKAGKNVVVELEGIGGSVTAPDNVTVKVEGGKAVLTAQGLVPITITPGKRKDTSSNGVSATGGTGGVRVKVMAGPHSWSCSSPPAGPNDDLVTAICTSIKVPTNMRLEPAKVKILEKGVDEKAALTAFHAHRPAFLECVKLAQEDATSPDGTTLRISLKKKAGAADVSHMFLGKSSRSETCVNKALAKFAKHPAFAPTDFSLTVSSEFRVY